MLLANGLHIATLEETFTGFSRGYRPREDGSTLCNKRTGAIAYRRGQMLVHSALRDEEWRELDDIVIEAAGPKTDMLADLPKKTHESIGVLASSYNVSSQMTEADVSMTGRSRGRMDAVDYNLKTVPLPVVYKEIEMGERELVASRNLGQGLDTHSVFEATRVVAEQLANMLYGGYAAINFNGATIFGLTTHPARNTGTGSSWGTLTNIHVDVVSMVGSSVADNYDGPWTLDVSTNQYIEMLNRYTDGSSSTGVAEVMKIPGLEKVVKASQLTDGSATLRQNTRNVLEWEQVNLGGQDVNGIQIVLLEWMSGDGLVHHMKVMAIATPVVKSDYPGQSGIVHFTGL